MAEGQAVVLDNPRDPMSLLLMGQQQQTANSYRQQQLGAQQRKAADADMNKVLAYKYDDPGERFRIWGQETINKANQDVLSVYQNNPNSEPAQMRSHILNIQGTAQKQLNAAKEINNIYNEKIQSIGSMKDIVDPEEAKRILNRTINKSSPLEVDRDILENIEQIPAVYDLNALVANSVSEIKDQFRRVTPGDIQSSPLGLFMEITDNKMRFKDLDKTIYFVLRGDDITDIGTKQKINGGLISDRLRYEIARNEVSSAGGDPDDVTRVMNRFREIQYDPKYAPQVRKELRSVLEQFNQEERDVNIQNMGKFQKQSMGDGLKENRLMLRDENLKNILNPFKSPSDAKPREESQKAVSRLLGGDFGGGKITKAEYERGEYSISPEYMKKIMAGINDAFTESNFPHKGNEAQKALQNTLRESQKHLVPKKGHKIKLDVKTGTIFGQPEEITGLNIDLSDPSAEAIINALMNKNEGEAKIPLDDVTFYRNSKGKKPGNIYSLPEDEDVEFNEDD